MTHPKIIGIIPARYGSTRFPGKPLVTIQGKSLIQRTYENALLCKSLTTVVVATDDDRIYEHMLSFGGNVVMTSESCVNGTDRLVEVIERNPIYQDAFIIVNIQGDEPCLEPDIVEKVIEQLLKSPSAVMSTAVMKLTNKEDALSSSVVKCVLDQQGNVLYFSRSLIPGSKSQEFNPATTYYKHLGIYVYRKEFLLRYPHLSSTPLQLTEDLEQLKVLEHGFRITAAVVESKSIGVDNPEDIKKVEQLLCIQNSSL